MKCVNGVCVPVDTGGWLWKEDVRNVTIIGTTGGSYSIMLLGSGVTFTTDQETITYQIMKEICIDGWSVCDITHWF